MLSHGPFHGFFQLSTWTSSGKSVDTTQKSTLKLVKITTFECDLLKTNGDTPPQSHKILQKFVWWGTSLCPHPYIRTSVKFRGFAKDVLSLSNLAIVLILRRSFQWCRRIFPD